MARWNENLWERWQTIVELSFEVVEWVELAALKLIDRIMPGGARIDQ